MSKFQLKCSFAGLPHPQRGSSVVLGGDPKKNTFVYCCDKNVVVRNLKDPKEFYTYTSHVKKPTCAKYAPNGNYICSGDESGTIHIWDTTQETHSKKHQYRPISGQIRDIAWDAESKRIAVCGDGFSVLAAVIFWDSGSSIGKLDGILKKASSVDLRSKRPFRAIVANDDMVTCFYHGVPFVYKSTINDGIQYPMCCRFSPDGGCFAVANLDRTVHLYNADNAELIGTFPPSKKEDNEKSKAHNGGVYSLCFSPDSKELITCSGDKTAKLWNVETREMLIEFDLGKNEKAYVFQQLGCLWVGDYILSVGLSGEIKYLDRNNPDTPSLIISGHKDTISAVATKPNKTIFTGDNDGFIVKWDPDTGNGVRLIGKGHGSKVIDMVYDEIDNQLVSVGNDDKIRYTDADSSCYSDEYTLSFDSQPAAIAITKEGLIVVSCVKELVLIRNRKKVCVLPHKTDLPVRVTAQGNRILASGTKGSGAMMDVQSCEVYDIEGDNIVKTDISFKLKNSCTGLEISPDGSKLVICDGKQMNFYELCEGLEKPTKVMYGHGTNINNIAWSPNSQFLISSSTDFSIFLWDMVTKRKFNVAAAHPKSVITAIDWLNDNTFVSTGEDCIVNQWSVVAKK